MRSNFYINVKSNYGTKNSQKLFVHLFSYILKLKGSKVLCQQLYKFWKFIERISPWFLEQGTFIVDMRGCIGVKI